MSDTYVIRTVDQNREIVQVISKEAAIIKAPGPQGPKGDPGDPFSNIDGGRADSVYGGIPPIDGGGA